MNKKLQVFVSSTYTDLMEERQAAVQAILDAGHIPAGMELFKAGNKSQLNTIYKWIDESDVYMLILGGRYGSIEKESGLSYTQLEYEYAIKNDIPVFAVVLNQSFLTSKINVLGLNNVIEQLAPDKYQSFKSLVMSKIIREVDDCKDIQLAIHSTLNDFLQEYNLLGWTRNENENDTLQLLKENNALIKENASLNKKIQKLEEQLSLKSKNQIGNYSFDDLVKILRGKKFKLKKELIESDKDIMRNALDLFITWYNQFTTGVDNRYGCSEIQSFIFFQICPYYVGFDLLEKTKLSGTTAQRFQITKNGATFYSLLVSNKLAEK